MQLSPNLFVAFVIGVVLCACSPVNQSERIEQFFQVEEAEVIASHSSFYRDFKDGEMFVIYKVSSSNSFSHVVKRFNLKLDKSGEFLVRGGKSLPKKFPWHRGSFYEQVQAGQLHSREVLNPENSSASYLACYTDGSHVYFYGRGWKENLMSQ